MQETEAALTEGLDPRDVQTARDVLSGIAERARQLRTAPPRTADSG